jgi:di/tricarboxylate transporter
LSELVLTTEMIVVLLILALTMYLFISEIVRVDVAAISVMVLLGLLGFFWPILGGEREIIDIRHLFSGFASNAVISIIAVMIIGAGLDKTGLMTSLAAQIVRFGGKTEKRIIPIVSSTSAFISSFMQNVGAAALLLPVINRISNRTGLPMSRLLMPMGFCAILGGTMTMIGSSPLILLNDLILNSNKNLPPDMAAMQTFNLFDVTPIGIVLVIVGILYFVLAGRYVLPANTAEGSKAGDTADYLRETYHLEGDIFEVNLLADSQLAGTTVEHIEDLSNHNIKIVASKTTDGIRISPARDINIDAKSTLALLGKKAEITQFAQQYNLELLSELRFFADDLGHTQAGISEVIIPPNSNLIGKSLLEIRMRKTYGLNVLTVYRENRPIREGLRHLVLQSGDILVAHSSWQDLADLEQDHRNFIVITTDYPHEELRPHKTIHALAFFALALGLVLFTDILLSVALFVGAVGMILSGVLSIDEAYKSISWKSVFLLASLLPLGLAVELTGTAAWIAQETLNLLAGVPIWVLQAALAVLATIFTLLMSNVAATVLLVPLAINIAIGADADPRVFALTVALATSNSFFIPTHQVNALLMGPGGYSVKDFMRAGGGMTILFLIVLITMLNIVF